MQFRQTGSHAIILYDSGQPTASRRWYAFKETKFYIREFPRLVLLRRVLKDVLKSKQQQQQQQDTLLSTGKPLAEQQQGTPTSSGKPIVEGNSFKVDLRIQGIPQDGVLEDQGRMTVIQELVDKLRSEYQTESNVADLRKVMKIQQVQQKNIKKYNSKIGKY